MISQLYFARSGQNQTKMQGVKQFIKRNLLQSTYAIKHRRNLITYTAKKKKNPQQKEM